MVKFHKLLVHHETETYLSPVDVGLQLHRYTCRTLKQSRRRQNAENGLRGRFPSCHTQRNAHNTCTCKMLKNAVHALNRIDCMCCVFPMHALRISGF